jgi:flavin reductase (DIM6/NTAB) family NADH-FMN oxidoreductase RutF
MTSDAPVDPTILRRVCGHWATGVALVTGNGTDGRPRGLAVNSFTSLSLEPPLILFAPAAASTSWPDIKTSGRFAVNILAGDQAALSHSFARPGGDKFAHVALRPTDDRLPAIAGAAARLVCEIDMVHAGGDHEIVIGRVIGAEHADDPTPLLFYRGRTVAPPRDLLTVATPA